MHGKEISIASEKCQYCGNKAAVKERAYECVLFSEHSVLIDSIK